MLSDELKQHFSEQVPPIFLTPSNLLSITSEPTLPVEFMILVTNTGELTDNITPFNLNRS